MVFRKYGQNQELIRAMLRSKARIQVRKSMEARPMRGPHRPTHRTFVQERYLIKNDY